MKLKITLVTALLFTLVVSTQAQKFAYIDTDYILSHVPEFAEAQGELNSLSADWQTEIERKYESVQKLEEAYALEKVLLTEEYRKKREEEIENKRKEAMDMQRQKFGVEGELFNKREELIQPIQDQIFEAIKETASSRGYMVIFDKAKNSNILYSNPKHDVSDNVIKKMGLKPGETHETPDKGGDKSEGRDNASKSNTSKTDKTGGRTEGSKTPPPTKNSK
jgi:outer membrane protein